MDTELVAGADEVEIALASRDAENTAHAGSVKPRDKRFGNGPFDLRVCRSQFAQTGCSSVGAMSLRVTRRMSRG